MDKKEEIQDLLKLSSNGNMVNDVFICYNFFEIKNGNVYFYNKGKLTAIVSVSKIESILGSKI